MRCRSRSRSVLTAAFAASFAIGTTLAARQQPAALAVASGRVAIEGTSNIHPYSASTTSVKVTGGAVTLDTANPEFLAEIVKPGALQNFAISVPAASLASGKDGLDKNMHKALKVQAHPDITFRLNRLQAGPSNLRALGLLKIAGVEREVAFDVNVQLSGSTLSVKGSVPLLMTDYGIAPPKAMLGMLKTDPKVTVIFEASFTISPAPTAGNS